MTDEVRAPDGGPLRVLLLTHVFPRTPDDPAAPFLLRYAKGLLAAGVEVEVIAPHDAGLPTAHLVDGVVVLRVRYGLLERWEDLAYRGEMHRKVRSPWGALRAAWLMWRLARALRSEFGRRDPHVLDVHWLLPGAIVRRLARVDVPTQVVVHGTDLALAGAGRWQAALARWALAGCDRVAASSGPLGTELRERLGVGADGTVTMPPALPDRERVEPPGTGRVLAVGRLVPEKGHADLIDAVARLRRAGRDVTLDIVGDGPEAGRLLRLASDRDVALSLPGGVAPDQLGDRYDAADVVVVPSRREGFGLVAAEALAHHRPVVATAVGGLTDIVVAGDTGWAVPPGDAAALADAIAEVLDDPGEAARRAERGAARVHERWSPEALGRAAARDLAALAARGGSRTTAPR